MINSGKEWDWMVNNEIDGMVYAHEIDKWVTKEEYVKYLKTII